MKPLLIAITLLAAPVAGADVPAKYEHAGSIEIAEVVSDFRVGFSLLTTRSHQYAAYYDAERRMTVSARERDTRDWIHQPLPSEVGWNSHNSVTMVVDADGHLHVSGNMHADPLVYFRTETPGDITTLRPATMTGELENRVTYPRFFEDQDGRLVFSYRHGGSGDGINIYNRYDPATRTWSRLLDEPLFDGEGLRNAYPRGPVRGPDGMFHVHWVWRHTPCCATNHHLSYARSPDLVHWESAFGERVELPIRFDHRELVVDAAPSGGGLINGGHRLLFDSENRPQIAYHRADGDGIMQIHVARAGTDGWDHRVLTDWRMPVHFSGRGSMPFIGIAIRDFRKVAPGVLGISYRHKHYGRGMIQIDASSLKPVEDEVAVTPTMPRELSRVDSDFPGIGIRRAHDLGDPGEEDARYILQWESLGPNQDQARPQPHPEPSMLRVHRLERRADHPRS